MRDFPLASVIVFAVLAIAGTVITALADSLTTGFNQIVLANMGGAIFAGGLAFFLIDIFRYAREQRRNR